MYIYHCFTIAVNTGRIPLFRSKQNTKEQSTKRNLQTAIGKKNITNKVISKDIRRDMNR